MATSVLLGANPLISWRQTSPITFSRFRPLSTKPLQSFTAANFNTSQLPYSYSKHDHKPKCYSSSQRNHFSTSHPLENIANEMLSNVLAGLKTPLDAVLSETESRNPNPNPNLAFDAIFNETVSNVLRKGPAAIENNPNPLEAIINEIVSGALKVIKTPAMAAVLLSLLLTFDPKSAWAASGGRVGGSSFSSRSSSSSSSRSSSPSYSSEPSISSSSSSRRSSPSSYSYSYSSEPSSSSAWPSSSSSRRYSPSYSSSWSSSSRSSEESKPPSSSLSSSSTSPDVGTILFLWGWGGMSFLIFLHLSDLERHELLRKNTIVKLRDDTIDVKLMDDTVVKLRENTIGKLRDDTIGKLMDDTVVKLWEDTVVKLQVCLMGSARALQKDLDPQATVALFRHPDYWISSYSSVTPNHTMEDTENCFNRTTIVERAKFDEETLVNVNNKRRKCSTNKNDDGFTNEYIVVTLLAAVKGEYRLPFINSSGNLKDALTNLGSISAEDLLATEVLWTPQKENNTLSEEELIQDYPLLKRICDV